MTTHLSGPVAVIRTQDDMLRESAERFHERARRENEASRLGDLRVWAAAQDKPAAVRFLQDAGILGADAKLAEPYRNTQDGWDWPNPNPAPPEVKGLPDSYWAAMKALGEDL
jgi:hypothetical protein